MRHTYSAMCVFDRKKQAYSLRPTNTPMTYTNVRDLFRERLRIIGLNPNHFGLHSMRAGGCTAATDAGVANRLVTRHGRWGGQPSKERYNEDSLRNRMKVSLNLGI